MHEYGPEKIALKIEMIITQSWKIRKTLKFIYERRKKTYAMTTLNSSKPTYGIAVIFTTFTTLMYIPSPDRNIKARILSFCRMFTYTFHIMPVSQS